MSDSTERVAVLDLDEHQVGRARVRDPVGGAPRHVDRLSPGHRDLDAVERDHARCPATTNQCSARWAWRW